MSGSLSGEHASEVHNVVKMTTRGAGMEVRMSAAEANRKFSLLLRGVREGNSYIITSHGRPVALVTTVDEPPIEASDARKILFDRLRSQPVVHADKWTRDELYEEEK